MDDPFNSTLSSLTASPTATPFYTPFGSPLASPTPSPTSTRPSSPSVPTARPPQPPLVLTKTVKAVNSRKRSRSVTVDAADTCMVGSGRLNANANATLRRGRDEPPLKKQKWHQREGHRKRRGRKRGEMKQDPCTQKIRAHLLKNHPHLNYLPTSFDVTDLAASQPGFIGVNLPQVERCRTLQEYLADGFTVIEWDGKCVHSFICCDVLS